MPTQRHSTPTAGRGRRNGLTTDPGRIRAIVETLRAVRASHGAADFFCELINDDRMRGLARRLGVPYLLLKLIDEERMDEHDVTPADLQEWNAWTGRDHIGDLGDPARYREA